MMLIACSKTDTVLVANAELSQRYRMMDLGQYRLILYMDISWDRSSKALTPRKARCAQNIDLVIRHAFCP